MADEARSIGTDQKQLPPQLVIVDGQQRLTSLYAVIQGVPVVRENYESEYIRIAFNPLEEKFEVSDAAIQRDKEYIPDISQLWDEKTDIFEVVDSYLERLEAIRDVSFEEKNRSRRPLTIYMDC